MWALFDDPRTFAVARQQDFRGWKATIVPTAAFRTLQPNEVSQVLAPISDCILVDRRKLLALGVAQTKLGITTWLVVFWKAAAAGWRSYSIGAGGSLHEQHDLPVHDSAFFLKVRFDRWLRVLGPAEPTWRAARRPSPARFPIPHGATGRASCWSRPFFPSRCRTAARSGSGTSAARSPTGSISSLWRSARKPTTSITRRLREVFRDVHIVDIDQRLSPDQSLPLQVRGHQSRALRALIAELARRWQPDLLQVEYTHMAHFRDAAPGLPAILVEHDLTFTLYRQLAETNPSPEADDEHHRWREFERRWLKAFDGVWTVSEDDREIALRESGRGRIAPSTSRTASTSSASVPSPASGRDLLCRQLPPPAQYHRLREAGTRGDAAGLEAFPGGPLRVVAGLAPGTRQFWKKRRLDPADRALRLCRGPATSLRERGGGGGSARGFGRARISRCWKRWRAVNRWSRRRSGAPDSISGTERMRSSARIGSRSRRPLRVLGDTTLRDRIGGRARPQPRSASVGPQSPIAPTKATAP